MAVDPKYGNSSGYFKDPVSGEDITPDTPRAVEAALEGSKFVWPCVMRSDGEQLLKIVFRAFKPEEKALYNQYRGRSPSGREPKPIKKEQVNKPVSDEPVQVVKHTEDSAAALKTLETLAQCDRIYGVSQIAGVTYVLCGNGGNVIHHIPRACIPDDEFERLNEGVE